MKTLFISYKGNKRKAYKGLLLQVLSKIGKFFFQYFILLFVRPVPWQSVPSKSSVLDSFCLPIIKQYEFCLEPGNITHSLVSYEKKLKAINFLLGSFGILLKKSCTSYEWGIVVGVPAYSRGIGTR